MLTLTLFLNPLIPFPLPSCKTKERIKEAAKQRSNSGLRSIAHEAVPLCSKQETYEEFRSADLPGKLKSEELELLNKPSPKPIDDQIDAETQEESKKPSKDELLEHFHRFFSHAESLDKNTFPNWAVRVKLKLDVNIGANLLGVTLTKRGDGADEE
nr:uncharacterized protein LOC109170066 [Ipomoea batatas]